VLDDLVTRGLRSPEFLIIDGAAGLEKALAALWPEVPTQRCTVHYAELRIMPTSPAKAAWEAVIAVKEAA
jgi:transposase-like protein